MPCAQGALARLAMKEGTDEIDFSTGATGFPFFRESLMKRASNGVPEVITGTREEISERARLSPYFYGGWITLPLSPGHAAVLFPWILGADASGTAYDLDNALQSLGVLVDKVTGTHEFYNGRINRAIIEGRGGVSGGPNWITCSLQMIFMDYKDPASAESYPSLTIGNTAGFAPMVFEDTDVSGTSQLVMGGSARECKSFRFDLNNHIEPRYVNALEPTALCPTKRTITLTTTHPYDSGTSSLYNAAVAGAAGTLTIVNGNTSILFTFGKLHSDILTPVVGGKGEIDLQITSYARRVDNTSTASLRVTIDSTP